MKIGMTRGDITFDLENGYSVTALGEMLMGGRFDVYTETMKFWDKPHDNEAVTDEQIGQIIAAADREMENSYTLIMFRQREKYLHQNPLGDASGMISCDRLDGLERYPEDKALTVLKAMLKNACSSDENVTAMVPYFRMIGRKWRAGHIPDAAAQCLDVCNPAVYRRYLTLLDYIMPEALCTATRIGARSSDEQLKATAKEFYAYLKSMKVSLQDFKYENAPCEVCIMPIGAPYIALYSNVSRVKSSRIKWVVGAEYGMCRYIPDEEEYPYIYSMIYRAKTWTDNDGTGLRRVDEAVREKVLRFFANLMR